MGTVRTKGISALVRDFNEFTAIDVDVQKKSNNNKIRKNSRKWNESNSKRLGCSAVKKKRKGVGGRNKNAADVLVLPERILAASNEATSRARKIIRFIRFVIYSSSNSLWAKLESDEKRCGPERIQKKKRIQYDNLAPGNVFVAIWTPP